MGVTRRARKAALLSRAVVVAMAAILGNDLSATTSGVYEWFFPHLRVTYGGNFSSPFSERNRFGRAMERIAHLGRVLESYIADMLRNSDQDSPRRMRIAFVDDLYGDVEDEKLDDVSAPFHDADKTLGKVNRFLSAIPGVAAGARVHDFKALEQKYDDNYGPVISPDGSKVVFRSWRKKQLHLFLYDCRRREYRQLEWFQDWTDRIAWSPDGRHVAIARDAALDVIGAESLEVEASFPFLVDRFLWLQDSSRIVVEARDEIDWPMIWVLKINPEISATQIAREKGSVFTIGALSPDGDHLLVHRHGPDYTALVTATNVWRLRPLALPAGRLEKLILGFKGTYFCMVETVKEAASEERENGSGYISENSIFKGDVRTGELKQFSMADVRAEMAASSADGRTLLLRTDRGILDVPERGTPYDFVVREGQAFVTSLASGCCGAYQVYPGADGMSAPVRLLYLVALENERERDYARASEFFAAEPPWRLIRIERDERRAPEDQVVIYQNRSDVSRAAKLLMARDSFVDAAISPSGEVVFVRAPDGGCYRLFDSWGNEIAPETSR